MIFCFVCGVLSVAYSMGVCSPFGSALGILAALCLCLTCEPRLNFPVMPVYVMFGILCNAHSRGGDTAVLIAVCLAGILLIGSSPFTEFFRSLVSSPCVAAVMLAGALTVTVMQTDNYFGIGAVGNTVREMLTDYVSRGFHPNWRGVLYGTIVMVVMITFPRKFKKASLFIRPAFLALIGTLVLNLFLNPSYTQTAIAEAGAPAAFKLSVFAGDFDFSAIPYGVLCGAAMWILLLYVRLCDSEAKRSDTVFSGIMNIAFSLVPGMFHPARKPKKYLDTAAAFCICAAIAAIMFIPFSTYTARMPVHSCAVVLIVGAWQAVNPKKLKAAFSSPAAVILFTLTLLASLLTNLAVGTLFAALVGAVYSKIKGCEALPNE